MWALACDYDRAQVVRQRAALNGLSCESGRRLTSPSAFQSSQVTEHDFTASPDRCPRCQEQRRNGQKDKPAADPGIPETAPGIARIRVTGAATAPAALTKTLNEVLADAQRALCRRPAGTLFE